ncbi:MAG: orotidine-5'-phosphate decarboxylase [Candidatus Omnitrophota bacterium]|nr:orotidine-5'-phosphate decarboxylase [Candidatus Omnitrophota bacterium]
MTPKERLIIALDVDAKEKALSLVEKLKSEVKIFKIGSELFTSCGPDIVAAVKAKGCGIFLDLKFHDIPNTAAKSAAAAARLGVFILNVHALGGYGMMKRCAESVAMEAKILKIAKPKMIAVTVLTSMDENNLKKIGVNDNMGKQVLRLAKLAKDASLDGVVASPSEVKLIRKELGEEFIIVTPGVRPEWAAANDPPALRLRSGPMVSIAEPSAGSGPILSLPKDDQKRVATPKEAVLNGATYIVVGRPITEAKDPVEAVRRILKEIDPASQAG